MVRRMSWLTDDSLPGQEVRVEIQHALHVGDLAGLGVVLDLLLDHGLAQRNADDTVQVVGHNALAAGQLAGVVGVGDQKFRSALAASRRMEREMRAVVGDALAVLVAAGSEVQLAVRLAQKDEAALGAGQAQRRFQQRGQNIVEHAAGVQLARRLQEDVQHFQVGARSGGRLPGGELAQELLRGTGGRAVRD